MLVKGLEYLVLLTAAEAFAVGYMFFFVEWLPALAAGARAAARAVRLVFLAIGWAVVVLRLLL